MLVKSALHGFENMLVLPSRDQSLLGSGTAMLDGATLTSVSPVATQNQTFIFGREGIGESFASRTDVNIFIGYVAEVLLAEAPFRLGVRGHRFWQRDCDARLLACQDLLTAEVAAIGDGIELLHFQRRLRLLGHVGEL